MLFTNLIKRRDNVETAKRNVHQISPIWARKLVYGLYLDFKDTEYGVSVFQAMISFLN